jgi:hypothetical protein
MATDQKATDQKATDQKATDQKATAEKAGAGASADLPRIDLSTFILSLSTSALYQLGAVAGPDGVMVEAHNRLLAKQTIDTLEMLHEKTRGNLDDQEAQLFASMLYELRMRFVSTDKE